MSIVNNLQDSKLLDNLDILSKMIFEQDLISESHEMIDTINKIFTRNPQLKHDAPELYRHYQIYLAKAKFVCLFELEENELLELMEKYFQIILDEPFYNIYEKLREYLKKIDSLAERDNLKNKIRDSLLKNRSIITEQKIKIGTILQEPTIANWLKDYYSKLGIDRADALAFNQYLVNDENTKNLSEIKREELKTLFTFFDKLKISSSEPGGLEESFVAVLPDGSISIINHGLPTKIDPDLERLFNEIKDKSKINPLIKDDLLVNSTASSSESASVSPLAELTASLNNYSPSSLEYKAIKQEIERLRQAKKDAV